MLELKMKVREILKSDDVNEKIVLSLIVEQLDETLVDQIVKYQNERTLNTCWKYIELKAKEYLKAKNGAIHDSIITNWAIHYFMEDDINTEIEKLSGKTPNVKTEVKVDESVVESVEKPKTNKTTTDTKKSVKTAKTSVKTNVKAKTKTTTKKKTDTNNTGGTNDDFNEGIFAFI